MWGVYNGDSKTSDEDDEDSETAEIDGDDGVESAIGSDGMLSSSGSAFILRFGGFCRARFVVGRETIMENRWLVNEETEKFIRRRKICVKV